MNVQRLPALGRNANTRCADVITCRCCRQHGAVFNSPEINETASSTNRN